jgi:hypothetical protein
MAVATSCVAVLSIGLSPKASASVADQKTVVTFSAPVEIPGKVLPPGTYVFKLLDSTANRDIVQIFDKDEKQLYATILAIPNYRMEPPDKPIITFEERASGAPEAIKAWFYPGDDHGHQFVYPQTRAAELAKRTNQNVLSMRNEMTKNMATNSKSASDSSVQQMQKTDVAGVSPSGEAVDMIIIIATKPEK